MDNSKSRWHKVGSTLLPKGDENIELAGTLDVTEHITKGVTATITASTTQTQGQGALTKDINEISVCANTNDTVTLPSAVAGLDILIINNGAETLQIFPASGDDLGAGVDTATTLIAGDTVRFSAYNATNWVS